MLYQLNCTIREILRQREAVQGDIDINILRGAPNITEGIDYVR